MTVCLKRKSCSALKRIEASIYRNHSLYILSHISILSELGAESRWHCDVQDNENNVRMSNPFVGKRHREPKERKARLNRERIEKE